MLHDLSWGGALKYSHMILGFSTVTYASTDLPDRFFRNAIDYDWTVISSYYQATKDTYGSDVRYFGSVA